jgi:hypothetical protein
VSGHTEISIRHAGNPSVSIRTLVFRDQRLAHAQLVCRFCSAPDFGQGLLVASRTRFSSGLSSFFPLASFLATGKADLV